MNTRILIPTPLRSYAGNRHDVEVEANNVVEALEALVTAHPGLHDHLFGNDGRLRSFVNIYLNDRDIRYLAESETTIGENDTISIIPAIAGGSTS